MIKKIVWPVITAGILLFAAYEITILQKEVRVLDKHNAWLRSATNQALSGCPVCKVCPVVKITYPRDHGLNIIAANAK